jgi:hypothetical protein
VRKILNYFVRLLIGIDQMANVLMGGWPDETISARCGRRFGTHWWWTWLGKVLNWIDPNHIYDAMKNERAATHLPPELR